MDGKPIEFVKSYSHLGHIINARLDNANDIGHRQGTFIGQVHNVLRYFGALNSPTKRRLFRSFRSSLNGCELWRLILACRISALLGERASVKYGNCQIEHMLPLLCHLSLTKYVHGHLTLSTEISSFS